MSSEFGYGFQNENFCQSVFSIQFGAHFTSCPSSPQNRKHSVWGIIDVPDIFNLTLVYSSLADLPPWNEFSPHAIQYIHFVRGKTGKLHLWFGILKHT